MAGIVKNRSSIEELNKQVNEMTARIAELLTNPEVYQVDTVEEMLVIVPEEHGFYLCVVSHDETHIDPDTGQTTSTVWIWISNEAHTEGEWKYVATMSLSEQTIQAIVNAALINHNLYSTSDEIVIGKWIDGKPIYRKTWEGSWGINGYWNNKKLDTTTPFEQIVNCRIILGSYNASQYAACGATSTVGTVIMHNDFDTTFKKITVEYTKTTDPVPEVNTVSTLSIDDLETYSTNEASVLRTMSLVDTPSTMSLDEEETEEKVGVFTKIKNFFTS